MSMPGPSNKLHFSVAKENVANAASKKTPPKPAPLSRPRTAFMCFKDAKMLEISMKYGTKSSAEALKYAAQMWNGVSPAERANWEEVAREDKVRYVKERAEGKRERAEPKKRAKKHPDAPRRPSSAFLKYSKKIRSVVKKNNPALMNTDVSSLLGEMWRNASPAIKAPFVEEEIQERAMYKKRRKQFDDERAKKARSAVPHPRETTTPQKRLARQAVNPTSFEPAPIDSFRVHSVDEALKKMDEQEGSEESQYLEPSSLLENQGLPYHSVYHEHYYDSNRAMAGEIPHSLPPYQYYRGSMDSNNEYSLGFARNVGEQSRDHYAPPRQDHAGNYMSMYGSHPNPHYKSY